MMQLYRIALHPVASFSSQLQSDTLFGAFCWSYRYCYGEEQLEALLERIAVDEETLIFSNAFPKGTLPLPMGVRDIAKDFEKIDNKEERRQAYQEHKKLKSAKFIQRSWFDRIAKGDYRGFTEGLEAERIQTHTMVHNMVSRDEGTVKNIDNSGSLYEENEMFMENEDGYDVYVLSSLQCDVLENVVEMMFFLGIGKNKSTGKGAFLIDGWHDETEILDNKGSNAFVALSNFVPGRRDPVKGMYKTMVKYGKLDREYATLDIPFKKPILFLQAGAVFFDDNVRKYYGSCIQEVSVKEKVIINAQTIALPIQMNL